MMKSKTTIRTVVCFLTAGLLVGGLGGATVLGPLPPLFYGPSYKLDVQATNLVKDLNKLGLLKHISQSSLEEVLEYQRSSGKTLAEILKDSKWAKNLNLKATPFKATWYASNPFDLLPRDLQTALKNTPDPIRTNKELKDWVKKLNAPERWQKALKIALVETTPLNLWRAAHGKKAVVKNGEFIKPIVIQKSKDVYEVKDGHIATDPKVIPTGSIVYILLKIEGKDRILKVKAADIGQGIRGKHVDLPIHIRPRTSNILPYIKFPQEKISNPTILVIQPGRS